MKVADIDLFEINEAFAAIPLKVMRDLGIDPGEGQRERRRDRARPPARRDRRDAARHGARRARAAGQDDGLVTMCIGGGMGIATIIERV